MKLLRSGASYVKEKWKAQQTSRLAFRPQHESASGTQNSPDGDVLEASCTGAVTKRSNRSTYSDIKGFRII